MWRQAVTAALWVPIFGAALLHAQTPAKAPEFEVASVKQVVLPEREQRPDRSKTDLSFVGQSGNPFKVSGNRVSMQGTALALIVAAYDVQPWQIVNAPAWADTLLYTVEAETEGHNTPTVSMIRPLMRSLLVDRFQLDMHRETKPMNVYHMVVSAKNPGLKQAAADEVFSWKLTSQPNGMLRSKATKESIGDFVRLVGVSEDRPVIDRTGFIGYIDYDIQIAPPESRSPDNVSRAIIDAVKDQLGLKLEPAKDTVDMLVVDRIDKPSEN